MGRIFDLDSPIMSFLSKVADLVYLNFLTLICCLPIVTIGASITSLHYVVLKMVRNEEGYLTKSFFKSFKENFKQATIIWIIMLVFVIIFIGDLFIINFTSMQFPQWIQITLLAVGVIVLFATMYIFPVLSKFDNSIKNTFKNSLFMGILSLPKTILMMVIYVIPIAITIFAPAILPIVFLFGISGPAFASALLYNGTFKRFEPQEESAADEEWTVAMESKEEKIGIAEDAAAVQENETE